MRALALAAVANTDDGAQAAAIRDVPVVPLGIEGVAPQPAAAASPENEVNISSIIAQLRILIRLIHHVQLRCLIRLIHPIQLGCLIILIPLVIVQKKPHLWIDVS